MIRYIWNPDIVRILCKHFQRYLAIFRDIDAYSSTLTGMQLRREGAGARFWKKALIVSIFGLNFPFKMYLCSCVVFFVFFFDKMFIEVVWFHKPPPPALKTSDCTMHHCTGKFRTLFIQIFSIIKAY